MRTFSTTFCLAALLALVAVGCSQPATAPAPVTETEPVTDVPDTTVTEVALVNTVCPLKGEPVDENVTVVWNGQTVGFCCEDCRDAWEKLTDDERAEKLAALDNATAEVE